MIQVGKLGKTKKSRRVIDDPELEIDRDIVQGKKKEILQHDLKVKKGNGVLFSTVSPFESIHPLVMKKNTSMTFDTEGNVELVDLTEESLKNSDNNLEKIAFEMPGINNMQQIMLPYNNTVQVRQRVQSRQERKLLRDQFITV